ncbi:DegT/DnrJ/EryC1/StrS family aminotransferase [Phycicoccus sonneratiae]|uniref:Aminotransferase class I/II-fold pyridoxal phosphate-dependent enzyme n=1 Tax=Phycicoccus sonneratiae TaxID=2807628 RepID=A0ABS2CPQ7_9MICO|nr:aminotransferase class I/II-fold pyridoxal phosphate-dependent enzyme [Phycicoccus sonneraticus]MBM6401111.1 aminotransferase class I/II-fold pyridoxal phosphate-dependent enzyme [Phycicoccus sonneraticus]
MTSSPDQPAARVLLSQAHVTEVEEKLVVEALRSGWVAPLGPFVEQFEAAVAERVGVASAVALSSGTAALHLALLHAGAEPGRVVVLPSMTFAATANAVLYTGAEPVFVDSRPDDANVDPDALLSTVSELQKEGRDVAAVVTVDLFGRAADHDVIEPGLAALGVAHVEDAAEALGATLGGRPAGSYGQSAALSFNGNKIMTTSGGGMLLSNDPTVVDRARYLATQARQPAPWYEHTEVGYNYRMSNLLAALGVGQLSRLDEMIGRRRAIRERYAAALAHLPGVSFLGRLGPRRDDEDNCWLTCILLDPAATPSTPDSVIESLGSAGIEARHLWKPMHLQPMYRSARMVDTGASADLFARGVTLPSGSALSDADIDRVIEALGPALSGAG